MDCFATLGPMVHFFLLYRFINLVNEKTYLGSSINLARIFLNYYTIYFLTKALKK